MEQEEGQVEKDLKQYKKVCSQRSIQSGKNITHILACKLFVFISKGGLEMEAGKRSSGAFLYFTRSVFWHHLKILQ